MVGSEFKPSLVLQPSLLSTERRYLNMFFLLKYQAKFLSEGYKISCLEVN